MTLAALAWIPLGRRVHAIALCCHHLFEVIRRPYRPELHYMRGPGPKWHAKHRVAS